MISKCQGYFSPAHGNLTFFLCRVAFLMIMVLSLAEGDDRILCDDSSSGPLIAQGSLLAVKPGTSFEGLDSDFQHIIAPTTTRSGDSSTYKLTAGWNLISINLNLDEESQKLLLSKGAMMLDSSSKAYTHSSNPTAPQGCWINCQEEEEITFLALLWRN